jgi:PAS domain S-box-containing protein
VISLGALGVFFLGALFGVFEGLERWFERGGAAAGNVFAVLLILAAVFAVFAVRRMQQAEREAELREEAERRFRTIVERVPAVAYTWDAADAPGSAPVSYISPQIEMLLGYTADEWLADPALWGRTAHPDDQAEMLASWADAVSRGSSFTGEYRMRTKDGRLIWVREEAVPVGTGSRGRPIYQGVLFDITEQKRAEERFRQLVEQLPVVTYLAEPAAHDGIHELLYMAPGIETLTGRAAADFEADPGLWVSMLHPDDRARVLEEDGRTERVGDRFEVEYRLVRADGTAVWVRDTAVLVERDEREHALWQGFIEDVSARREAERRLDEADRRFRALVEQIPAVTYIEDHPSGQLLYVSPQIFPQLGYTPEEWTADPGLWLSRLHPDDQERVRVSNATVDGDRWSEEYRTATKDGRIRWIRNEAILIPDEEGGRRFWIGFAVDITERMEAQEQLRVAQDRYRHLVERLPTAVYIDAVDAISTATYVSPQYEAVTGYTPEERLAEPDLWVRMLHPDDRAWVVAESERTNATGDPFDIEYRIVAKDGAIRWIHDLAYLVDEEGDRPVWQGVLSDITERKLAEEGLARRDRILEAVGRAAERFLGVSSWMDAMTEVLGHLGAAGSASRAAVYRNVIDGDGRVCVCLVREWTAPGVTPLAEVVGDRRIPFEEIGLDRWRSVLEAGEAIHGLVGDFPPEERATLERGGLRALVVMPIVAGGRWWGHLAYDQVEDDRVWQQAELDALRVVANTLGAAIGREEAARKLSETEARYQTLIEQVPAITYMRSATEPSQQLYISPQVRSTLGYEQEEWSHQGWASAIHPDDRDRVIAEDARSSTTGEPFSCEYRMIRPDGRIVWIQDDAVLLRDARGAPMHWQGVRFDVTARKEAEGRLREAEERYRSLIETIPAATYIDTVDAVSKAVYVSPQVRDIFGYEPEEWLNDPELWERGVHPDDLPEAVARIARLNVEGIPYEAEYRFTRPDGRIVWVHDQAVVIRDELGVPQFCQGVMFDITERREAEEQLREAEERFRAIVEHVPAAIYLDKPDASMETLYMSPQVEEMTGITADEWVADADAWKDALAPEDRDRVLRSYLDAVEAGIPWSGEYRIHTRDGRTIWVRDETVHLHDEEGNPSLMQGVIFDITEMKLAEQALRESEQREREAAERLRALDEMKNTFLAAVSHELRSPLTSILGLALTLERSEMADDDRTDLLERLAANARKLDRLLKDLLDIDRLNRGIVEPQYRVTDVGALARRTIESLDPLADRSIMVFADPVVLSVDPAKVERIVENLLMNAARHTAPDRTIWLRVQAEDGGVLICVEDDGPGVPEELREAIFEPFRQGPTASPHAPGTGIGLSLVGRFAELHGGSAWVQDREGGGASFRVFLPAGPVVGSARSANGNGAPTHQDAPTVESAGAG